MKIKTIRIHYEEGATEYQLFDRDGSYRITLKYPIEIYNLKIKRFGFCIIDTVDITLELEKEIDDKEIVKNDN